MLGPGFIAHPGDYWDPQIRPLDFSKQLPGPVLIAVIVSRHHINHRPWTQMPRSTDFPWDFPMTYGGFPMTYDGFYMVKHMGFLMCKIHGGAFRLSADP